jgi:hypothetical protein
MDNIIENFVVINLCLFSTAIILSIILWRVRFRKQTAYLIPIWIYLLNSFTLYILQFLFEVPADFG